MHWIAYALAGLFALLGLGCLALVLIGLPGLWLMVGLAAALELADAWLLQDPGGVSFGWGAIAIAAGLGLAGEAVETVAGAAGSRLGGGTRRGMAGALVGGLVGAVAGTLLLPAPLVGTLAGALAGTFAGAWVGEATGPEARGRAHNLRAAFGATVGRLGGTLGKTALAAVAWVLLVRAAFRI
jgi:uncharacterized protein YqgC (DUF456 family)